jgi:hypothetical protein
VIVLIAVKPFDVIAVMVTSPGETAVTTPADDTIATEGSEDPQITVRFVAFAGWTSATNVTVSPTASIICVAGVIVTPVGCIKAGAGTVIVLVAVKLFAVLAVIVAIPSPLAVTKPVEDTVATAVLDDVQVTVRLAAFCGCTSAVS